MVNINSNGIFQMGDLQTSYIAVQKSLYAYPGHNDSRNLFKKLERHFFHS